MRAPCGLSVANLEAFVLHVCRCPEHPCCDFGVEALLDATALRRGGARIDPETLREASRVLAERGS
jgi:hypothetical protein